MQTEKLDTAKTVGESLKVHPVTVQRWAREGKIPAVRLSPRAVRFRLTDVMRALEEAK